MEMVELEEWFNGKEVETCDSVSRVKKHFRGVSKSGNKWRARVRHPKLKVDIHLGRYSSPEAAALAVKKKKAEFEEMFKGEDCSSMKTCRGEFEGRKLPYGVRRQNGMYQVRIWQSELKKYASFGFYSTCEEAAIVADIKRAESEVASKSEFSDEQTGDVKVPRGVTRIKSGKWVARIRDPESRSQIWLGTYNTAEEAIRSFNKKKAEFAARTKRPESDGSKDNEGPGKFGRELGYDSPTSSLGADDLKNIAALGDKSNCVVVDIPGKLGDGLVCSSPSVFDPENSNRASVSDKTCGLDFDRAVSLGFINEYGQLLGKFSELDENMGLGFPDENVAATGYY